MSDIPKIWQSTTAIWSIPWTKTPELKIPGQNQLYERQQTMLEHAQATHPQASKHCGKPGIHFQQA